jgi:acetyl esterase/lipase
VCAHTGKQQVCSVGAVWRKWRENQLVRRVNVWRESLTRQLAKSTVAVRRASVALRTPSDSGARVRPAAVRQVPGRQSPGGTSTASSAGVPASAAAMVAPAPSGVHASASSPSAGRARASTPSSATPMSSRGPVSSPPRSAASFAGAPGRANRGLGTDEADVVVLHLHGGGFVSQSPETHQVYLRQWCERAGVPVLSVDYSLADGAPFPNALLECYMVYRWLRAGGLGAVPRRVIVAGDSAGGNLSAALAMLCIRDGVSVPERLALFYPALHLCEAPSPSRLLACNDPVIPRVFMEACLTAYTQRLAPAQRDASGACVCVRARAFVCRRRNARRGAVFVSPLLASRDMLRRLPPVTVCVRACALSPLMHAAHRARGSSATC